MADAEKTVFKNFGQKNLIVFLAFVWCLGLSFGTVIAIHAEPFFSSLMFSSFHVTLSIVGLLLWQILPLILSMVAVRLRAAYFVLPIAFIKSFVIGFCQQGISIVFMNAAWLAIPFILFSGFISNVLLLCYWFLYIRQTGQWHVKSSVVFLCATAFVCLIDYFFISPYWATLIV